MGRPSSGSLFSGALFELSGNFDECQQTNDFLPNKFCFASFALTNLSKIKLSKLSGENIDLFSIDKAKVAICAPKVCKTNELIILIKKMSEFFSIDQTNVLFDTLNCANETLFDQKTTNFSISTIVLFTFL